jgi:uncharacterized protein YjiS (DUF1127 family)
MLNLAFALIPSLGPDRRDAEEGFLGKLVLWARQRIRYHRALHELQRLDDRNLADIGLARDDIGRFAQAAAWPGVPPGRTLPGPGPASSSAGPLACGRPKAVQASRP